MLYATYRMISGVFILLRYEDINLYNVYEIPIVKFGICEYIPNTYMMYFYMGLCDVTVYVNYIGLIHESKFIDTKIMYVSILWS